MKSRDVRKKPKQSLRDIMERRPILLFCYCCCCCCCCWFFFRCCCFFCPKTPCSPFTAVSRSVVKCRHGRRRERSRYVSFFNQRGGIEAFVLTILAILNIRFSVFVPKKTLVFRFSCSFRFTDITRFSIWFSVFVKNTNGFSEFFRFVFDLSGNEAPPLVSKNRETQMLLRGMRNKPNVLK